MAITITIDQHTASGEAAAVRRAFINQAIFNLPPHATDVERLEAVRAVALRVIEAEVDMIRAQFIPKIQGQEIVYVYKAREARAFENDLLPDADKYPHIYAEATALRDAGLRNEDGSQPTPATVAAAILANDRGWPLVSAAVEAVRVPTGRLLRVAATVAEVEAVLAGVVWPGVEAS